MLVCSTYALVKFGMILMDVSVPIFALLHPPLWFVACEISPARFIEPIAEIPHNRCSTSTSEPRLTRSKKREPREPNGQAASPGWYALIFEPCVHFYMYIYIYISCYRRKFRSQTSDNMDRWKAEVEQKNREEKIREEKESEERRCRCAKR